MIIPFNQGVPVWCSAFSPDGNVLATGGINGAIKLWCMKDLRELMTLTAHQKPVLSLDFSSDGAILDLRREAADLRGRVCRQIERRDHLDAHTRLVARVRRVANGRIEFLASEIGLTEINHRQIIAACKEAGFELVRSTMSTPRLFRKSEP